MKDESILQLLHGLSLNNAGIVGPKLINKNGNIINRYIKIIEEEIKKNKIEKQTKQFAEKLEHYLKILINYLKNFVSRYIHMNEPNIHTEIIKKKKKIADLYEFLGLVKLKRGNKNYTHTSISTGSYYIDKEKYKIFNKL